MNAPARYLEAPDGTRIAYTVDGAGPPLLLTNGLTTTAFFWKYLRPIWLKRHTVITWDYAGHGLSEPARTDRATEIAGQPAIITRIMDALEIACATQIGWSVGCQVVLELARQVPDRCDALVLLFGPAEHALSSTNLPYIPGGTLRTILGHAQGGRFAATMQWLTQLTRLPFGWALLRQTGLVGPHTDERDLQQLLRDFRSVHPETGQRMACSAEAHSARDVLPHLTMPVLILAGDRDPFAPFETVGAQIHRETPGSELVRLANATHTALLDYPVAIVRLVESFLVRHGKLSPAPRDANDGLGSG
jgi:pimeloyl-ACP methyl ester carboxylesterase